MNPADLPHDPRLLAATGLVFLLAAGGLAVLVTQAVHSRGRPPPPGMPAWPARWLDFALWLWVILATLVAGGFLAHTLAPGVPSEPDVLPGFSRLLTSLACTQGLLLAVQLVLLRVAAWSPAPVNRAPLSAGRVLGAAVLAWLALYPLLLPTVGVWQAALAVLREWVPGLETPVQDPVRLLAESRDTAAKAVLIFFAVVVAPMNEELVFRAGLYRFFKGRLGPTGALVAANLLFALAHFNVLTFLPLFLIGALLTRAYERSGHLAVPMLFHALFNLTTIAAMLLLGPDLLESLQPPP